ncbi:hypothetical protein L9F63_023354, partial [Diploptera punctata]
FTRYRIRFLFRSDFFSSAQNSLLFDNFTDFVPSTEYIEAFKNILLNNIIPNKLKYGSFY